MRIAATNATARTASSSAARRTAGGGFAVPEETTARDTAQTGNLRSVGTIDALIALQGFEDPAERKKRSVAQGRKALDMLDGLKVGVLDGNVDPSMLSRLKVAAEGLRQGSGDIGLDAVLGEIELRVEVELAKAGVR